MSTLPLTDSFSHVLGERRGRGESEWLRVPSGARSFAVADGVFTPVLDSEPYEMQRGDRFTCEASCGAFRRASGQTVFAAVMRTYWSEQGEPQRSTKLLVAGGELDAVLVVARTWQQEWAADPARFTRRPVESLTRAAYERRVGALRA